VSAAVTRAAVYARPKVNQKERRFSDKYLMEARAIKCVRVSILDLLASRMPAYQYHVQDTDRPGSISIASSNWGNNHQLSIVGHRASAQGSLPSM
jgi:hypothetical protein